MNAPVSFMDPEVQRCPFPVYEQLRELGPVYVDPVTGWYFVMDYELVRSLTADTTRLSSFTGILMCKQKSEVQDRLDRIYSEEGFMPMPLLVVGDNPQLVPTFVEETLRLDAPVQGLFREPKADMEIAGVRIPKGSVVVLKWGAANRDPTQFPNPDAIDLQRTNASRHLTFSFGPHVCVGNQLARGEIRISVSKLLQRLRNFRFSRGADSVVREGSAPVATIAVDPAPDATAAVAPPPDALRARGIEEIVVTAQKREERIQDVPIAISAFSGDTLNNLGVTDTRDLSRLVPGFNANESGRNTTLFTLRGVGFADTTYTATNTVGTYIDEVNLPFAVMTRGANLDIERVEVLKGPQGTLYGRNTTGGLINYIAKAPTEEFEAGTLTSFSRYDSLETENFISGPLTDSLLGRFAFKLVRTSEGWQQSNVRRGSERLGEQEKLSGRGSLDWKPADNWFVRFRAEGWLDRSDPTAPQAVGVIPGNPFIGEAGLNPAIRDYPYLGDNASPKLADWPITEMYPGELDDYFHMESIKTIWNIDDSLVLTAILSHLEQDADNSPQLQGLNISATDLFTTANIKTNALEVRLSDTWNDGNFYWSLGGTVSRDRAFEEEFADTTNAGALFAVLNQVAGVPLTSGPITDKVVLTGEPRIKQHAVFLNTDTRLGEHLSLNLGARYSKSDQKYRFCATEPTDANADGVGLGLSNVFTGLSQVAAAQYALDNPGMLGRASIVMKGACFSLGEGGNNDPFVDQLNQSNVSGRAALSWKTDAGDLYFVSLSRGFKSGGFPVLNPARKAQLVPVVQEELLAYEVGTKLSLLDSQLYAGFGAFYYDYTDKQLLTKTLDDVFGPLPILQNAPESHVYGVELEARFTPIDGLLIAFAGSYIKTKIDRFVGTNSEGNEQDFAGLPFNFAPETQISLVADYTWPMTQGLDVGVAADYDYTGDTNGAIDENPLLEMNAYSLIGARVHLGSNDGNWTPTVFGRNLGNELVNQGSNSWSEAVTRNVGRPRVFGLSINVLWQ